MRQRSSRFSLLSLAIAASSLACSSTGDDAVSGDGAALSPLAIPTGLYRNLDPAVQNTTATVYFAITLAPDGTYTAERGPGVVCGHCVAGHWTETGDYQEVYRPTWRNALELRPNSSSPRTQFPLMYKDGSEIMLYQPTVGIFQLSAVVDSSRPTLPNGNAHLVGERETGDPFDSSKPWVSAGSCALDLTVAGGPTADGHRYTVDYLVPYSEPLVSGRVAAVGKNGSVQGNDSVNSGEVVQRSWNRTLSLSLQSDGRIAWSFTDREAQTTTVGGPAGGIGNSWTALWKCSGVADANTYALAALTPSYR